MRSSRLIASAAILIATVFDALPAHAIPAFARKYGTSCQTCHVVYPKLTPFGEAFRRNGNRFPGVDSDYVKQEPVALGQDEYKKLFPDSVWPGSLPPSVPIAIGFNGTAVAHPDKSSNGAKADNQTPFSLQPLVGEAQLWLGGSYDDQITYFGELTWADGASEIEWANIHWNDLVGPKHAVNVVVGRFPATVSTFGFHSTYVGDAAMPSLPVSALFGGASHSFAVNNLNNGVELNGVIGGYFDYAVGVNAGSQSGAAPTEDAYAQVGYKLFGMRLDGEGMAAATDPEHAGHPHENAAKPWAENAVTLDLFAYHSNSRFTNSAAADQQDVALAVGGAIRAQYGSLELTAGGYQETHSHALATGEKATALTQYDELSYIVFPWLVPAVRVEYATLTPQGGTAVTDLKIIPGIAMLIRPNLKLTLAGQLESAKGAPDAGWGPFGGASVPATPGATVNTELQSVSATLATAF